MNKETRKIVSVVLTLSMIAGYAPFSARAEQISDGVTPSCDEAYYVMTDFYGNPTDTSVVKSYTLNGATKITDYGDYDSVSNMTNSTEPVTKDGTTTFDFGTESPEHFYFEGKTAKPFSALPWTVSLSYKLNGVPKKAEELAGEKGEVEISVDAVPNQAASEYAKNNYTLEAVAAFNQDDILSLDAPDAQVMTIGNLRVAAFIVMPGEEQHFSIRVGANEFKFDGMTFVMGPVNSGRLSKITDLKKDKQDIEDSYNSFNDAFDEVLDSMDNMKSSLNGAAGGLDSLNKVRANVHSRKSTFYADFDSFNASLGNLSSSLAPVNGHFSATNNMLTDLQGELSGLNDTLIETQKDLDDTQDTLTELQSDTVHTQDAVNDLDEDSEKIKSRLDDLQSALGGINTKVSSMQTLQTAMEQLHAAYLQTPYSKGTPSDGSLYYINATDSDADGDGLPDGDISGTATTSQNVNYMSFPAFADMMMTKTGAKALYGLTDDEIIAAATLYLHKDTVSHYTSTLTQISSAVSSTVSAIRSVHDGEIYDVLYGTAEDANTALGDAYNMADDAKNAITKLDALHTTIDGYIPELQSALNDAAALTDSVQSSVDSLQSFLGYIDSIMKDNSEDLNSGADEALKNTSDLLRKASGSIDSTDKMRKAQDTIKDLIDSKWDKYTGGESNILNMDPDAAPQSLTSAQNTDVSSVSVLIRSKEIKVDNTKAAENAASKKDNRTFGQRVAQMFKDIWHFLTGWIK